MTPDAPSDRERLHHLVEVWHVTALDALALLRSLDDEDWSRPTDLPGWDVRAVAAHLAHLESALAGTPQPQVEVPDAPHVHGAMGRFTESGPVARRDRPVASVVDELAASVETRYAAHLADPPTDASVPAPGFAGALGWTLGTLLSNRPVDLWMHDQDVRRAVGRPGGLDTPGAAHTVAVFAGSLPFVLGKRAAAAPGEVLVVEVTGEQARTLTATVGESGRGVPLEAPPDDPTVRLWMDTATFVALSGGRVAPGAAEVAVVGDTGLARRVLAGMAVTP